MAAAIQWVADAYGHLKMIGFDDGGQMLATKAGLAAEDGVMPLDDGFPEAATRRYWAREPNVRTLA